MYKSIVDICHHTDTVCTFSLRFFSRCTIAAAISTIYCFYCCYSYAAAAAAATTLFAASGNEFSFLAPDPAGLTVSWGAGYLPKFTESNDKSQVCSPIFNLKGFFSESN